MAEAEKDTSSAESLSVSLVLTSFLMLRRPDGFELTTGYEVSRAEASTWKWPNAFQAEWILVKGDIVLKAKTPVTISLTPEDLDPPPHLHLVTLNASGKQKIDVFWREQTRRVIDSASSLAVAFPNWKLVDAFLCVEDTRKLRAYGLPISLTDHCRVTELPKKLSPSS